MFLIDYCYWFYRTPLHHFIWFIISIISFVYNNFIIYILNFINYNNIKNRKTFNNKNVNDLINDGVKLVNINYNYNNFDNKFHEKTINIIKNEFNNSLIKNLLPFMQIDKFIEKKLLIELYEKNNKNYIKNKYFNQINKLFIIGLPRTGSTYLHELFNLNIINNIRCIKAHEYKFPSKIITENQKKTNLIDNEKRILKTKEILEGFYKLFPRLEPIHKITYKSPDECVQGFNDCLFPEWYLW